MTLSQHKEMQKVIRETPFISGFSYPFLRLLVDKARELEEIRQLATDHGSNSELTMTSIGAVTLHHVSEQVQGGWNFSWSAGDRVQIDKITGLLEAAEAILAVFEEKP